MNQQQGHVSLPQVVVDVVDVLHHKLGVSSILSINILDLRVSLHGKNVHLIVGDVHVHLLGFLHVGGIFLLFGSSDQSRLQRLLESLSTTDAVMAGVGGFDLTQSRPLQIGGSCTISLLKMAKHHNSCSTLPLLGCRPRLPGSGFPATFSMSLAVNARALTDILDLTFHFQIE